MRADDGSLRVMTQTPQPPKPRRRWWRWLLLVCTVVLAAVAGLAWWAWRERVMLVNVALDFVVPYAVVEVKEVELEQRTLRMGGVRAWWRDDNAEIATIRHLHWKPHWRRVLDGELGRVQVEGAVLHADLPHLRALSGTSTAKKGAAAKLWRLDEVVWDELLLEVVDDAGTLVTLKLRPRIEGLEIGGAVPRVASVELRARELAWRGQPVLAEAVVKAKTTDDGIEISELRATDATVELDAWLAALPQRATEAPQAAAGELNAWPRAVVVRQARLENARVSAKAVRGLAGALRLTWQGREIAWRRGLPLTIGPHDLQLTELALRPVEGEGAITLESLHVDAKGLDTLNEVKWSTPRVIWTQALEDALLQATASESSASGPELHFGKVSIENGDVAFAATKRLPVSGALKWSAQLNDLVVGGGTVKSAAPQQIDLESLQLAWGTQEPFVSVKAVHVVATPDKVIQHHWIDALKIEEPRVVLKPENGPWFDKIASQAEPLMTEVPVWKRFGFGELAITNAEARASVPLAERLELDAAFSVEAAGEGAQRLLVRQVNAVVPARRPDPVAFVRRVEVEARLPEMWQEHRIESVQVGDGHVDVGQVLMSLFATPKASSAEEKVKELAARWTARSVNVEGVGMTLEEVAPKFPPIHFSLNFAAENTPLDLDGLAENVEPQQVTLRNLRIPSPFRPLNAVAEMSEIHIRYTLDGLLHRRIDRVDIVRPMLFVGEDLFWYVENYRRIVQPETETLEPSFIGPPQPLKSTTPGWRVDTLAVAEGRLVVAPKGTPVKGLGDPFPFSFETKLESGELNAELEIPNEDRELAHMKLRFTGLRGKVKFNLPMKDRNNNVVEVFQADRLQWKNLHAENTHLSITYDRNGIYGNFYAKAYEGDVNGAFNIYMDDAYTWDGWLALTKTRSGPVTRVLFPEYLLIDGIVSGKVVATGDSDELYQADLEFLNDSKGRFEVSALNDVIKGLPKPMRGDLAQQIQRIGLETLRDFDYDSVDGHARFYGREGRGHLRFAGPHGKRTIEVRVFDHRWKAGVPGRQVE